MNTFSEYIIPFRGLRPGEHNFEYHIKKEFWNQYESAEIMNSDLSLLVKFINKPDFLVFKFIFSGTVTLVCDRCLDEYLFPLNKTVDLYVKFSQGDEVDETDNMVIIPRSQGEINLIQYIYEYIMISIPYQKMHTSVEFCNKEMIQKLAEYQDQSQEQEEIDPRWDKLKQMINKQ